MVSPKDVNMNFAGQPSALRKMGLKPLQACLQVGQEKCRENGSGRVSSASFPIRAHLGHPWLSRNQKRIAMTNLVFVELLY
jgi:hypothetical protein